MQPSCEGVTASPRGTRSGRRACPRCDFAPPAVSTIIGSPRQLHASAPPVPSELRPACVPMLSVWVRIDHSTPSWCSIPVCGMEPLGARAAWRVGAWRGRGPLRVEEVGPRACLLTAQNGPDRVGCDAPRAVNLPRMVALLRVRASTYKGYAATHRPVRCGAFGFARRSDLLRAAQDALRVLSTTTLLARARMVGNALTAYRAIIAVSERSEIRG